jgi:segregation and condensation protein B
MELKFILESLLFSAQKPLNVSELRALLNTAADAEEAAADVKAFKKTKEEDLTAALEALAREHEAAGRSYRLAGVAGAWQFVTQPEYAPWLRALVGVKARPPRLSQAALETLAIIAYRQPVTRAEVEQVRGVNVDGTMQTLLERGLVEQSGRAEVVGRPALYSSTAAFLEYFGLRNLEDLPAADELRRIVVEKPPAPVTADFGLATAPPEQLALAPNTAAADAAPAVTQPEAPAEAEPKAEENNPPAA